MKKLLIPLFVAALALASGCRVVSVENKGEDYLKNADGTPLIIDGKPVTVKKGWSFYHNQHWMTTSADAINGSINPNGEIRFGIDKINTEPSEELKEVIERAFSGAALLAEKVGAAIATYGASVAGDAAASALNQSIRNFVAKGGDASKATVTCADGNCTITDGDIIEECANCLVPRQ